MSNDCVGNQETCDVGRKEELPIVEISSSGLTPSIELERGQSNPSSKDGTQELEDPEKIEVLTCNEEENSLQDADDANANCSNLHVGLRRKLTDSETKLLKRLNIESTK